jgi:hypothetical protein
MLFVYIQIPWVRWILDPHVPTCVCLSLPVLNRNRLVCCFNFNTRMRTVLTLDYFLTSYGLDPCPVNRRTHSSVFSLRVSPCPAFIDYFVASVDCSSSYPRLSMTLATMATPTTSTRCVSTYEHLNPCLLIGAVHKAVHTCIMGLRVPVVSFMREVC